MKKNRIRSLGFVFGVLYLCAVWVAAAPQTVCVGGHTVGMKVQLEGLLVSSVEEQSAAQKAGLRNGDRILQINGIPIKAPEELIRLTAEKRELVLKVERNGSTREISVIPEETDGSIRLGIGVQSELTGIGTITYYDPETGQYGALGHGICGGTKGQLYEITGGILVPSVVTGVIPSKSGTAGQLEGSFQPEVTIGTIRANTKQGVFGTAFSDADTCVPVADPSEIEIGEATLLSNVEGDTVGEYQIRIIRKLTDFTDSGRDLLLVITDEELLNKTGGIVQGMSGSPILQNGKLIGAVTHVLVNAPNYGYGITIGKMLHSADKAFLAA